MSIIGRVRWPQREKLARVARKARDPKTVRRAMAIRQLAAGRELSRVAEVLCTARSTLYCWKSWYREGGIEALCVERRGRARCRVDAAAIEALESLLEKTPQSLGYLRSRWSSELLAKVLAEHHGVHLHAPTVRRGLGLRGWVWRRARPTLHIADPRKAYLAGALHARTGRVVWTGGLRKDSALFLSLLEALERSYPHAERLVLILDNYAVHKSRAVQDWFAAHPGFELLFQPAYHPWVNRIERLWKAMHDTVTRNHRCRTLEELCDQVVRFLEVVQPFPGAGHALATSGVKCFVDQLFSYNARKLNDYAQSGSR